MSIGAGERHVGMLQQGLHPPLLRALPEQVDRRRREPTHQVSIFFSQLISHLSSHAFAVADPFLCERESARLYCCTFFLSFLVAHPLDQCMTNRRPSRCLTTAPSLPQSAPTATPSSPSVGCSPSLPSLTRAVWGSGAWVSGQWHCPVCRKVCCCALGECLKNHRHCKAYRYRVRRAEQVTPFASARCSLASRVIPHTSGRGWLAPVLFLSISAKKGGLWEALILSRGFHVGLWEGLSYLADFMWG